MTKSRRNFIKNSLVGLVSLSVLVTTPTFAKSIFKDSTLDRTTGIDFANKMLNQSVMVSDWNRFVKLDKTLVYAILRYLKLVTGRLKDKTQFNYVDNQIHLAGASGVLLVTDLLSASTTKVIKVLEHSNDHYYTTFTSVEHFVDSTINEIIKDKLI